MEISRFQRDNHHRTWAGPAEKLSRVYSSRISLIDDYTRVAFLQGKPWNRCKKFKGFFRKNKFQGFFGTRVFFGAVAPKKFGVLPSSFTFDSLRISAIPFNNMIERNNPERYIFPIFRILNFNSRLFQNRCTIFKTIDPNPKPLYQSR